MARLIDLNGDIITDGVQGSRVCDAAAKMALRLAAERHENIQLEDDDGNWLATPAGDFIMLCSECLAALVETPHSRRLAAAEDGMCGDCLDQVHDGEGA